MTPIKIIDIRFHHSENIYLAHVISDQELMRSLRPEAMEGYGSHLWGSNRYLRWIMDQSPETKVHFGNGTVDEICNACPINPTCEPSTWEDNGKEFGSLLGIQPNNIYTVGELRNIFSDYFSNFRFKGIRPLFKNTME